MKVYTKKEWQLRLSESLYKKRSDSSAAIPFGVNFHVFLQYVRRNVVEFFKKWVWPGNATITHCRPTNATVRKLEQTRNTTWYQKPIYVKQPALSSTALPQQIRLYILPIYWKCDWYNKFWKVHSHCAGVATVHPDAGQPVYRDTPGHIS